jgi:hypothetical protein
MHNIDKSCEGATVKERSTPNVEERPSMTNVSHIHVRPLELADFDFVQALASKQPNFTVPPVYVLWLMLRIKGAICLAAEHNDKGLTGYLLAVPVEGSQASIFVWQLAASNQMTQKSVLAILAEFRKKIIESHIETVLFSGVPDSPRFRAIRQYSWQIFEVMPHEANILPSLVAIDESEFVVNLLEKKSIES